MLNEASIILETVSFFLVTLDLYGKNRLEKLQERSQRFFKKFNEKDRTSEFLNTATEFVNETTSNDKSAKQMLDKKWFLVLSFLLATLLLFLIFGAIFDQEIRGRILTDLKEKPFSAIVHLVGMLAMFGPLLYWWIAKILNVLEITITWIFDLSLKLLGKYKMEGVFMIIGTILFLISKGLALVS